jgi:pimeloyl-ACP methyl ester carboxylesterase
MAMLGENLPRWAVILIWALAGVFIMIRKVLTLIPFVNELIFYVYAPKLSSDEEANPRVYRDAMLEVERQLAKQHLDFATEHEFVEVQRDIHLHVVHVGDKKKPLMLFLHGFPEFYFTWRHLLREFSRDYHCVAVDQRGYNVSSKPRRYTDYSVEQLVTDIESLVGKLGYDKCVLVAHDWGGNIAWHVAHATDVVSRLVMFNMPHPSIFTKALRTSADQQRRSLYMLFFNLPHFPEQTLTRRNGQAVSKLILTQLKTAKGETRDGDAFAHAAVQPGAMTGSLNWYRAALGLGKARKWLRKQIEAPVLLVFGMDDVAFDTNVCLTGYERYAKDFQLVRVPNCSHWTANDRPDKCIEAMRKFL